MPGPVADRLALMSTTRANLEPIFLLYGGSDRGRHGVSSVGDEIGSGDGQESRQGSASRFVDDVALTRSPLVQADTDDGLRHRLWAVTDRAEIDAVNADLQHRQALIADGHHRYATYRELQHQEHARHTEDAPGSGGTPEAATERTGPTGAGGAAEGVGATEATTATTDSSRKQDPGGVGPWDFGLALLVDTDAYPPDLKAIHRVIPGLPLEEAAARAKGSWQVRDFATLEQGLDALEETAEPAFLLAGAGACHLMSEPDPVQLSHGMPQEHSAQWNAINVAVLTEFVMPRVWSMRDDERSVRIVHHDARAATELAAATGGTAVILKPLAVEDVVAVAAGGERVPRKSTSFGPKPRTGLVLRTFDIE